MQFIVEFVSYFFVALVTQWSIECACDELTSYFSQILERKFVGGNFDQWLEFAR
jgi:hypothetical protein